jgi:hypothetical protein
MRAEPARRITPLQPATPVWAMALAWLLAAVFLATALGKALDVAGFALVLREFRLLPETLLTAVAHGVVVAEFGIMGMLLWPASRAQGALAAMLLFGANAAVLVLTLWRGIALENCGCFGVFLARPLTWVTPLEDLLLLILAGVLWRAELWRAGRS